jgi:hypothetical protein
MEPEPSTASASPPADPHPRISLLEILGYCGIAAGLFGTFAALEETSGDPRTTVLVTSLVLSVVFLLAGALIGVGAPDRLARLRSVCWFASIVSFTVFLASAIEPSGRGSFALVTGLSALAGLVLWALSPRTLQQLAFFTFATLTLAILIAFPDVGGFLFGPPDVSGVGIVLYLGGAIWFALGFLELVRPPRPAMVIGMIFGLQGLSLLGQESAEAAAVLILASSALCLFFGGSRGDRAVTGVAVVGLLVGTVALLAVLEVEGTGPGLIALFVGVVLLGIGVWQARTTGPGNRAAFGPLASPFGRPKAAESTEAARPAPPRQIPPPPDTDR